MTSPTAEFELPGFIVKEGLVFACNGIGFKNMLQAGQVWLEARVNIVNDLNVFPVPDGDTGTNMVLTMRSALAKIEEAPDHQVGTIAEAAAQGALMGARGNSGVILSQFLRGIATGLVGQNHFTTAEFANALKAGAAQAYQSVMHPVEGTILTVARAVAEAAQQSAATSQDLTAVLAEVLRAAKVAQAKTPELLPILKEAGVTDSGGQGLLYILEGALRLLKHEPIEITPKEERLSVWQAELDVSTTDYGYDVQFLLQGEQLKLPEIRAYIDSIGWSTLVVGDERMVKVHLHTHDPGLPLSYGVKQGIINDIVIENLQEQAKEFVREHTLPSLKQAASAPKTGEAVAAIAVVPGQGLARIFQSLGVSHVLTGGQTMNPSVQELLAAIDQVKSEHVLILPNNRNVILAAQQAQILAKKRVEVIPTTTIPQGVTALLGFNRQADLENNIARMIEAMQYVQSIEVTQAVRDSSYNGFNIKPGDVIGLLNNDLVSVGSSVEGIILEILTELEVADYEVMTIYVGQDVSRDQGQALARTVNGYYPDLTIELHPGGQPQAKYIISLE